MKKNLVMRIAAVVLMCTLVTACFASSTFAKYTSEATASDVATVAKWSISMIDNGDTKELAASPAPTITFNLFDTVLDTLDGEEETDVAADRIAPGTQGSFKIDKITNTSEVRAKVTVKAELANEAGIPFEWSTDGSSWTDEFPTEIISQDLNIGANTDATTIYWKWAIGTEGSDNAIGIAAQKAPQQATVTLNIVADQID